MNSIDVLIPSYRLNKECLLSAVQMNKPANVEVKYLIVADNPNVQVPIELNPFINDGCLQVIINEENKGAQESRNIGIDNSHGNWILFLDDDVIPEKDLLVNYCSAIKKNKVAIGFFGETLFPPPFNSFTKGIIANNKLDFFFIAARCKELKWATTSNVAIERSVIGDVRFQEIFPKNGGGEDLDFFLKIFRKSGKELKAIKNAKVYHDWWDGGKRNYRRFARWSYGNAIVNPIFPEYLYYEPPNFIESLIIGVFLVAMAGVIVGAFIPLWIFVFGLIVGEIVFEFFRLFKLKGWMGAKYTIESILINASSDFGQLYSHLFRLKRVKGICERFDHYCDGKRIKNRQFWASFRIVVYFLSMAAFYVLARLLGFV